MTLMLLREFTRILICYRAHIDHFTRRSFGVGGTFTLATLTH